MAAAVVVEISRGECAGSSDGIVTLTFVAVTFVGGDEPDTGR